MTCLLKCMFMYTFSKVKNLFQYVILAWLDVV